MYSLVTFAVGRGFVTRVKCVKGTALIFEQQGAKFFIALAH